MAIFEHFNPLIDDSTGENFIPILSTHAEINLYSWHIFCPQKSYDGMLFLFGAVYKFHSHFHHKVTTPKLQRQLTCQTELPGERQGIPLEIALMKMVCRPPNFSGVIQLLDWCTDPYDVLLILERPEPCMELHYFVVEREEYLEEPLARDIFQQIVEAVQHCHSRGVFHRDVKMNNILIQIPNHQIKLIDFDCGAHLHGGDYSSFRGTSKYAPPEWFTKKRYQAVPATAWSLGIVLYGLVCATLPFHNREETINGKVSFSRNISLECRDLILRCLSLSPSDRPSPEDILKHSWMTT
uniref:non-specific serine/threonine protein kinase n=1 Tax=Erpetoichthys calabaricus TaxID=27687 RepID=A0A8C4SA34_ERPCA